MKINTQSSKHEIQKYYLNNLNRLISTSNQKKSKLIKLSERIHRYLNRNSDLWKHIPIHPDDFFLTLALRKNGVIPNYPIVVLGGPIIQPTKTVRGV